MTPTTHVELTSSIVAAYVGNNPIASGDLPDLIRKVHDTVEDLAMPKPAVPQEPLKPVPAVSVRASIKPDYLVCLEDGLKLKSLKRHLRTHFNLSPEEYRDKWNLPADYPMVAPNYSALRSRLAKANGLGQKTSKVPNLQIVK